MIYIILFLLLIFYLFYELNFTCVENLDFKLGLNIYQISDYHSSIFVNLKRLKNILSKDSIDVVILTGDLVNRSTDNFSRLAEFLEVVSENSKKVIFVSGNHELENKNYFEILELLQKYNVEVLDGSYIIIESTLISNVDISKVREDYKYSVFADHFPIHCENIVGYDLRICGHTHGGQIRIPFVGAIIDHDKNIFPKNQKGLYEINNNLIYIDSGIGERLPIRIFNRSKVTRISRR